jgi:hypothetical protein
MHQGGSYRCGEEDELREGPERGVGAFVDGWDTNHERMKNQDVAW